MKKRGLIPLMACATLLCMSCFGHKEHVLKGTLYADSAKTIAAAGDTLVFRAGTRYDYDRYLGQSITDAQGRWAFQYIEDIENPYQNETGTRSYYPYVIIMHGRDTMYTGRPDIGTITLYPGCWRNYTNISDSTTRNGVVK